MALRERRTRTRVDDGCGYHTPLHFRLSQSGRMNAIREGEGSAVDEGGEQREALSTGTYGRFCQGWHREGWSKIQMESAGPSVHACLVFGARSVLACVFSKDEAGRAT
jgi:hypothetical protein